MLEHLSGLDLPVPNFNLNQSNTHKQSHQFITHQNRSSRLGVQIDVDMQKNYI